MIKWIAAALAASLMLLPAKGFALGQDAISRSGSAYVEDATNASVTAVAGTSNAATSVYGYIISVSAADTVYLKCGAAQKTGKVYLGANSGVVMMLAPASIRCNAGEAVSFVKGSAGTPMTVTVFYSQDNP